RDLVGNELRLSLVSHRSGICLRDHSRVLFRIVTTVSGREGIRRTFRYSLYLVASLSEGRRWVRHAGSPVYSVVVQA
ncbi:MAG: hypothetical protein V3S62_08120, partial [Acidimicrobiia bacterium]